MALIACISALSQNLANSAEWGDLEMRFVLDGKTPERRSIGIDKNANFFGPLNLMDESLLINPSGGIANVVVYVRSHAAVHPELNEKVNPDVGISIVKGQLEPRVVSIWVGKQALVVENRDPVGYSLRVAPMGGPGANLVLVPRMVETYRIERPQLTPVPVNDTTHSWIKGYVVARPNPYVAISTDDGTLTLEKLPVSELEVQVWHERAGFLDVPGWPKGRARVVIKSGTNRHEDVKIPVSAFSK
jgi:hypothetical protein